MRSRREGERAPVGAVDRRSRGRRVAWFDSLMDAGLRRSLPTIGPSIDSTGPPARGDRRRFFAIRPDCRRFFAIRPDSSLLGAFGATHKAVVAVWIALARGWGYHYRPRARATGGYRTETLRFPSGGAVNRRLSVALDRGEWRCIESYSDRTRVREASSVRWSRVPLDGDSERITCRGETGARPTERWIVRSRRIRRRPRASR